MKGSTHRRPPPRYKVIARYKTGAQTWTEEHEMREEDAERMLNRLPLISACYAFEIWHNNEKLHEWRREIESSFPA